MLSTSALDSFSTTASRSSSGSGAQGVEARVLIRGQGAGRQCGA